ncbi:MAG: hypothetical protein IJ697_05360 [Synergistaceae bacterium]|nr:hypothetical protein [Synergistaceae bacterium]
MNEFIYHDIINQTNPTEKKFIQEAEMMKAKKFSTVFLLLFVTVLLPLKIAEAMPETTPLFADLYSWILDDEGEDFESSFESNVATYFSSPSDLKSEYDREFRILRNRKPYSQEQARNEIARMIDAGELPYYIIGKGSYSYTPGINSVYTTTNVNLRSQPNLEARIITVVRCGGYGLTADGWVTPELSDYLGEWTNPNGDTWVLVKYRPYPTAKPGEKKLGWLSGKYVRFFTDSQVAKIADIYENPKKYMNSGSSYRYTASQPSQQSSYSSGGNSGAERVSAETLGKAYASNPYKAQKTYEGKILEVRGKIERMTSNGGTPVIEFEYQDWGKSKFAITSCFVSSNDPLLADIETGGYATIRGYVSKVNTGHWPEAYKLTNCKIISAN